MEQSEGYLRTWSERLDVSVVLGLLCLLDLCLLCLFLLLALRVALHGPGRHEQPGLLSKCRLLLLSPPLPLHALSGGASLHRGLLLLQISRSNSLL